MKIIFLFLNFLQKIYLKYFFKYPFKKIFFVSKITDLKIFVLFSKQILVEVFPISPII